jgi:hypothetical protein
LLYEFTTQKKKTKLNFLKGAWEKLSKQAAAQKNKKSANAQKLSIMFS